MLKLWLCTRLSPPTQTNFADYLRVLMSVMTMLAHISAISVPMASFAHAVSAANVFFSIIDAPKPICAGVGEDVVDTDANITIENVNFAYPTRHDVKVLDGLSLCIRAGQKTAIVGPSGSGKSTTVALIQRWYELGEADPIASYLRNGLIKIGNTELNNIDLRWWRSQIGLVQQEPFLFDDTVFNNVALGLTGTKWESSSRKVKERLVIKACKEAYAHDFICLLPEVCTRLQCLCTIWADHYPNRAITLLWEIEVCTSVAVKDRG